MALSSSQQKEILEALGRLSPRQLSRFNTLLTAFGKPVKTAINPSRFITQDVVDEMAVRLVAHHASSTQAMTKMLFEHALNDSLNSAGIPAQLHRSQTNRGHDITILDTPVSLKTEAAAAIRADSIHISKWMELGKGEWHLPTLVQSFLDHLQNYNEIYTLRRLHSAPYYYELVQIPKELMLMSANAELEVRTESRQNPQPGYGHVRDHSGNLLYSLYFDGGSERKLQIKSLRKDVCIVRATWEF